MKTIIWTDENGIKHRSVLQDGMNVKHPEEGYIVDPPDVSFLNWKELSKELHNELVNRGLFTTEDIVRSQNGLTAAILSVFRKVVKDLYRKQEDR